MDTVVFTNHWFWDAETEEWAHRKSARWNSFVLSQDLVYVDDGSYSLDAGETFVDTRPLSDVPGEAEGLRKVVAVGLDVVAMVNTAKSRMAELCMSRRPRKKVTGNMSSARRNISK